MDTESDTDDRPSPAAVGGEQHAPPGTDHEDTPRDEGSEEPLGPATPDEGEALGDTAEAHDELSPVDLPRDHPGRKEAERLAAENGGTTKGNL